MITGCTDGFTENDRKTLTALKAEVESLREELQSQKQTSSTLRPTPKSLYIAPQEYKNGLDAELDALTVSKGITVVKLLALSSGQTKVGLFSRNRDIRSFISPTDLSRELKKYGGYYSVEVLRLLSSNNEQEMKQAIIRVLKSTFDLKGNIGL